MSLRPKISYEQRRVSSLITPPAEEPITVEELREALKLPLGQEEFFLQSLIIESREFIEYTTDLAFLTQTWLQVLDSWPSYSDIWWNGVREVAITELYSGNHPRWIELIKYPLQTVSSVTTYNADGVASSVNVSDIFHVDIYSRRGRMVLKDGQVWPAAIRSFNAIEIEYVAGFGSDWQDVPINLRAAVRQMAIYKYQHRGDCSTEDAFIRSGAASLVSRYRAPRI